MSMWLVVISEVEVQEEKDRDNEILQLTILGIPNSGKSTLLNTLLKTDRFITGSVPGLTRDTVSTEVEYKGRKIRLVDTPGIPKTDGVLPPSLNSLSIYHAHKQLDYAHVVALILDGSRILTKHDLALAKEILDKGRGLFIVLNKSDVMQSTAVAKKQLVTYIDRYIPMVQLCSSVEYRPGKYHQLLSQHSTGRERMHSTLQHQMYSIVGELVFLQVFSIDGWRL